MTKAYMQFVTFMWRTKYFFVIVDWIINIIIPQIRPEKKVKK